MSTIAKRATLLTAVVLLIWSGAASAQPLRGRFAVRRYAYAPFFYDPFWTPYPYAWGYPVHYSPGSDVRVEVTPKQAEVYVDGFYAGLADDFDGVFKRLHTTPGGHAITLRLDGYRTVTENIYTAPDHTTKLRDTLEKLRPGETSAPPPAPAQSR